MPLKVADRPCDQCLFHKNRVVSEERAEEVLAECEHKDLHFVCHNSSIRDPQEQAMCAEFHRQRPRVGKLHRMARHLNLVEYIDVVTGATVRAAGPAKGVGDAQD
jgi:hypothetical protein